MNIEIHNSLVIVDGVQYYRVDNTNDDKIEELEGQICAIQHEVRSILDHAQALYDDYKREGLTTNLVEAEGYLRAAKELSYTVESIKNGNW